MIDEEKLKLFALNCAILNVTLEDDLEKTSISNRQSDLEIATDRLTKPFVAQIDLAIRQEAERMAEYYKLFYMLENYIRVFIKDTLEESDEEWWENLVPQAIKDSVNSLVKKEVKEGIRQRSEDLLDYTTFGELGQIIVKNWGIFGGLFSSSNQEGVTKVFYKLNLARGPIAHCGVLPEDEVIRLKLTVKDWFELF